MQHLSEQSCRAGRGSVSARAAAQRRWRARSTSALCNVAHIQCPQQCFSSHKLKVLFASQIFEREGCRMAATACDDRTVKRGLTCSISGVIGVGMGVLFAPQFFEREGCRMVEMACEEHDRIAAGSQFITHTIGRVLGAMAPQPSAIDTRGYEVCAAGAVRCRPARWRRAQGVMVGMDCQGARGWVVRGALHPIRSACVPSAVRTKMIGMRPFCSQNSENPLVCRDLHDGALS